MVRNTPKHEFCDENMTGLDTTTLEHFDLKVNSFFAMFALETFDELLLHHDMRSMSFSEILTWIKWSARQRWKAWRTKEVDWGPIPCIPHVLHQATTSLLAQGKKEIQSNTFWGWIRTAALPQLATAATTSSGLRLRRSRTSWKPYQVHFQMDPVSYSYLFGVGRNRRLSARTFSSKVLRHLFFWPMGHVSS